MANKMTRIAGVIAVGAALVLSTMPAANAAAPKTGSTCKVLNQIGTNDKGKTVVCKSAKNKRTWTEYAPAEITVAVASATWAPKEEVAVISAAKQLGYYAAENLTVKYVNTQGSIDAIQIVGAGGADITPSDAGAALGAIEKGGDVVVIGGLVQNWPWSIATLASNTDIKTPADLKGKKIGIISRGSGSFPFTRGWMAEYGLKEGTDVTLVETGGAITGAVAALNEGRVDAIAYYGAVYAQAENAGTKFRYFDNPDTFDGVRSLSWTVKNSTFKAKSEIFERFLRASFKGLTYSATNPKAAMKLGYKEIPALLAGKTEAEKLDPDTNALTTWIKSATPKTGAPESWRRLGDFPAADWIKSSVYVKDAGTITKAPKLDRVYNGSLITRANNFDRAPIVKAAKAAK